MELNDKQLHILNEAESLFAGKGYDGTSVREIARAAGVNVAMISYYFGSKEKLLWALMRERWDRSNRILEELDKDPALNPWQKIERVIDFFVDTMLGNRNFHVITNRRFSLTGEDNELSRMLVNIMKRNRGKIIDILNEGKRKSVFRNVDSELTIGTIIGTISQTSTSQLYYAEILGIATDDEEMFFEKMSVRLKKYLKKLLKAHLMMSPKNIK